MLTNSMSMIAVILQASPVCTLEGHDGPVNRVQWNPTMSNRMASCGDDGSVRVWVKHDSGFEVAFAHWEHE